MLSSVGRDYSRGSAAEQPGRDGAKSENQEVRSELIWEGKYDEHGRRREVEPSRWAAPLRLVKSWPGSGNCLRTDQPTQGEWRHRLMLGDNRAVMSALLSEYRGQIDLIYADPPFNLGCDVTMRAPVSGTNQPDNRKRAVAYRDRWGRGPDSYAQMMYERLTLMRDLLSETGSLYVHCDTRMNGVLRLMLDEIFGPGRLCNEIIWHYQSGGRQRGRYSMKHDTIFLYTRSDRWTFNLEAVGKPRGRQRRNHMKRQVGADGRAFFTIKSAGKIYTYYEDDLLTPADVWTDISHIQQKDPQRCGYPTQKPEALLERIVLGSSHEGDLVADLFCGSGTTGVVAERFGRRWILCDSGRPAIEATIKRLLKERQALASAGRPTRPFDLYESVTTGPRPDSRSTAGNRPRRGRS